MNKCILDQIWSHMKQKWKRKWKNPARKKLYIFQNIIIINNDQCISRNIGAHRLWNRYQLLDNVRNEHVAGHVATTWWNKSPQAGMLMRDNVVPCPMIRPDRFHEPPLLINSRLILMKKMHYRPIQIYPKIRPFRILILSHSIIITNNIQDNATNGEDSIWNRYLNETIFRTSK